MQFFWVYYRGYTVCRRREEIPLTPALLRPEMNDSSRKEFSLRQKGEEEITDCIIDAFTVHREH